MQISEIEQDTAGPATAPQAIAAEPLRTQHNAVALIAVCLAAMMFSLEISSVPVILPTLEVVLHGDFRQIQWIMNAYTIACTTVLMATGTLADRFGRKRIFIGTIGLFGIASLLCGLARDSPMLIASRALQGASGGAMLICLVAVLSHQFPQGAPRARAFSVWGIVLGIGLGFGPLVGGVIVALANWQWVFWIHVGLAVVTFVLALIGVQESRDPQARRLDMGGMATLSAAIFGFVWFITQGADGGFTSAASLAVVAASAASLALFYAVESHIAHPMFDFSVFKVRNFSGALLGSVGMNFSFWAFIIYLPIYFQGALGEGPVAAGLSLLAYTLPTLVFPPIGERLALRYRPATVIPAGLLTIGLGFFLMWVGSRIGHADGHANALAVLPGCLLAGAGLGLTNTPVTNTTTGSVSAERAGMASGIDMSARMITLAINIALMGLLLVKGVSLKLQAALGAHSAGVSWNILASRVAAGDLLPAEATPFMNADMSAAHFEAISRSALIHGFGGLMLYGALAVSLLAAISFCIFRGKRMES